MLVRVHSECLTGDVFHSLRCDCGQQLESALAMIETEGQGVLLYHSQEGRGIGLLNKLRAYKLQEDEGSTRSTPTSSSPARRPARLRHRAQILVDLGLSSIRILTNNPRKIKGLEGYGLSVSEQVPIVHLSNPQTRPTCGPREERMGHMLHHQDLRSDVRRPARGAVSGGRFAIVVGRFYEDLADRLVAAATEVFEAAGAEGVDVFDVPGAFELPLSPRPTARRPAGTPAWRRSARSSAARPRTTTTSARSAPAG